MSYLVVPIETHPEIDIETISETLATQFPGFELAEGNLETWLIRWWAESKADLAELIADVSGEVFHRFGEEILGLPPIAAAAASTNATFTLTDDDGHVVPEGTQIEVLVGDDRYGFRTISELIVANGDTEGTVEVQATLEGEAANAITGEVDLIDSLAFVESVALDDPPSGGVEAEDPDDYRDRLKDELTLLTPRPILPVDVEVMARRVAGVERATAIDGYDIGTDEVQSIIATGGTAGDFTLTYSGQTTAAIAYNASAATVQTRLEALSNIGVGDVTVTGGLLPNTAVVVTFTGALAKTNVATMTVTDSITDGTAAVTVVTGGEAPSSDNERIVSVAVVDEDGLALSTSVKNEVDALLEAEREINMVFHVLDPSSNQVKVSTTVKARPGFDAAGVEAAVEQALTDYLDPANWGIPGPNDNSPGGWRNETLVRRNELIALVSNVDSVDYVTSLTLALEADVLGTSDVTLVGVAPLTTPGTLVVTVT